ncbi:conserved hypothetical protein [Neospora caninum Liverpool]|uniref:CRAL-TRIO domain-containing protein n=1 Tax=Neospora caninum (strain Liverpool) TaxID=572307 RepID=F0VFG9_NEOCL|nr:conserved hypothetical protein [Neospora caninum Liverpool]CBZ52463.1 conserved hypothetical protein [Neospora caninum Liverpool]|eukprot:XP_003882495.1 conserved hypothetical protein [Neospora caninum Liverpool]
MNRSCSSSSVLSAASSLRSSSPSQECALRHLGLLLPPPPFACLPPHLTPLLGQICLGKQADAGEGAREHKGREDRESLCGDIAVQNSSALGKWTLPEEALLFDPFVAACGDSPQTAANAGCLSTSSSPAAGGLRGEGRDLLGRERHIFGNSPVNEVEQAAIDRVVAELRKAPGRLSAGGAAWRDGEKRGADGENATVWIEQQILRFLYSSGFDINKTIDLMQSALVFRTQHLPVYLSEVLPLIRDQGVAYWHGRDKCLRPLLIICVEKMQRVQQQSGRDIEEDPVTRAIIFCLEFFLSLLQASYRGRMYRFYLLNTPRFFHMLSRPLLAAMPASSAKKLRVFGSPEAWIDERKANFACHQLEAKYGGSQPNIEQGWFPFRFFPGPFEPDTPAEKIRWDSLAFLHQEAPPSVHTGFSLHSSLVPPHCLATPSPCGSTATSSPTYNGHLCDRHLPPSRTASPDLSSSSVSASRSSCSASVAASSGGSELSLKGSECLPGKPARFAYWASAVHSLSLPATTAEWLNQRFGRPAEGLEREERERGVRLSLAASPYRLSESPTLQRTHSLCDRFPSSHPRTVSSPSRSLPPTSAVSPVSPVPSGCASSFLASRPVSAALSPLSSLHSSLPSPSQSCFQPTTSMAQVRERWAAEKAASLLAAHSGGEDSPSRIACLEEIREEGASVHEKEDHTQGEVEREGAEDSNAEAGSAACGKASLGQTEGRREEPVGLQIDGRHTEVEEETRQGARTAEAGKEGRAKRLGSADHEATRNPTDEGERAVGAGPSDEESTLGRKGEETPAWKTRDAPAAAGSPLSAAPDSSTACLFANGVSPKESETPIPTNLAVGARETAAPDGEFPAASSGEGGEGRVPAAPRSKRRGERFKRRKRGGNEEEEPTLSLSASSSLAFVLWKRKLRLSAGDRDPVQGLLTRLPNAAVFPPERRAGDEGWLSAEEPWGKGRRRLAAGKARVLRRKSKNASRSSAALAARSSSGYSKGDSTSHEGAEETRVFSAPPALSEVRRGKETGRRWRKPRAERGKGDGSGASVSRRLFGSRDSETDKREMAEGRPSQVFGQLSPAEKNAEATVSPSVSSMRRFASLSGAATHRACAPWRALRLGRWRTQSPGTAGGRGSTQLDVALPAEATSSALRHPETFRPRSWTKGDTLWVSPTETGQLWGVTFSLGGETGDYRRYSLQAGGESARAPGRADVTPHCRDQSFQELPPGLSPPVAASPCGSVSDSQSSPHSRAERPDEGVGRPRRRRFLSRRYSRGRGLKEREKQGHTGGERQAPVSHLQSVAVRRRQWLGRQRPLDSHRGPQLGKAPSTNQAVPAGRLSTACADPRVASSGKLSTEFEAETATGVNHGTSPRVDARSLPAEQPACAGGPSQRDSESPARAGVRSGGDSRGQSVTPAEKASSGRASAPSLPGNLPPSSFPAGGGSLDCGPLAGNAVEQEGSPLDVRRAETQKRRGDEQPEKADSTPDAGVSGDFTSPASPSQNTLHEERCPLQGGAQNRAALSECPSESSVLEPERGSTSPTGRLPVADRGVLSSETGIPEARCLPVDALPGRSPSSLLHPRACGTPLFDSLAGSGDVEERKAAQIQLNADSVCGILKPENFFPSPLSAVLQASVEGRLSPLAEDVARESVATPDSENDEKSVELVSFAVRSEVDSARVLCSDSEETEDEAADAFDASGQIDAGETETKGTDRRFGGTPERPLEEKVEGGGPGRREAGKVRPDARPLDEGTSRGDREDSRAVRSPVRLAKCSSLSDTERKTENEPGSPGDTFASGSLQRTRSSATVSASANASLSSPYFACGRAPPVGPEQESRRGGEAIAPAGAADAQGARARGKDEFLGSPWDGCEKGDWNERSDRQELERGLGQQEGSGEREETGGLEVSPRGTGVDDLASHKPTGCEELRESRAKESERDWRPGAGSRAGGRDTRSCVGPMRKSRGRRQQLKKTLVSCFWKSRDAFVLEPETQVEGERYEGSGNAGHEPPSPENACVNAYSRGVDGQ